MYQFFNTNEHPLYHVVGEQDVRALRSAHA